MSDGHFECKVSGRRESANGIFLTLQINPADLTTDLAMLRVGSALMVGWSEVVDTAVHKIEAAPAKDQDKQRKSFGDLPLVQQAGIRSGDAQFAMYLMDTYPRVAAGNTEAAQIIRELCQIDSRSQITEGSHAGNAWQAIESKYQGWLVTRRYADSFHG